MQNQQFRDEDRAELEGHFAERLQAYVELGETPEQAVLSARAKFGETEAVVRELHWQRIVRQPLQIGMLAGVSWLAYAAVLHQLTGSLVAPIIHERQPFPLGGGAGLTLLVRVYATLAPAALLVAWKGAERFPRHARTIVLGIMAFSLVPVAFVPDFAGFILVPTLHGALIGWRLAHRARQKRQATR